MNAYKKVDPSLLWYVNTTEYQKRLTLVYFMCPTAFKQYHDNNKTCCNVCLYKAIGGTGVLLFSLHSVTSRLSKCYYITTEYQLERVKVEQEKTRKKALQDKTASATTQVQEQR